jgi:hypothetical protein
MPLTTRDFDAVVKKLQMHGRSNDHRFVYLIHEGRQVVWTARSHGRGELGAVEHTIRRQLRVNSKQMSDLVNCPMTRDDYIGHLKAIGAIEPPKSSDK